jgi:membrane-associated phospholipid phosphatase
VTRGAAAVQGGRGIRRADLPGIAWAVGVVLFVVMAALAAVRDTFPGDLFLTHRWQDVDVPVLGGTLAFVNALGFTLAAGAITVGAAALAALRGRWLEGGLVVLTLVPRGLQMVVKDLVGRARPSEDLVRVSEEAGGAGFPSGHVVGAVVFYGLLLYLTPRLIEARPLRLVLALFCVFMILATGPARVYTGAHWPSDTVGGYLFGLLCLAVLIALDRTIRRPQPSQRESST